MLGFFAWMMGFLSEENTARGALARRMFNESDRKPGIMLIDSFADLVGLSDPKDRERYINPTMWEMSGITESLWLEFCEVSGHPVNPPQESRLK